MPGVTASLFAGTALADIKIGFIRSLSSNTSFNTLCGAKITIEKVNAVGGMSGEKPVFVSADMGEDVTEDVKAYGYLAEAEEVDSIISGSIDDVSLGWLLRMQGFQILTPDARASYIDAINMVIRDPETIAPYFVDIASGEALAMLYINFGVDVLKEEMGWDSVVILAEDATSGEAVTGLITEVLGPITGIKTKKVIVYDVGTAGFASLSSKAQAPGAGFIHQVSPVDSQVISSQYVKLQVPMAMTGMDASALGLEYWEDTGGAGGGISTLSPIPSIGFELDPESQKFVDTYQAKYDSRPKMPHFNGFNAYWGLKQAVAAAEAAGGPGGAEAWSAETKRQDITLKKNGKMRLRYAFWGDDEVEGVIGRIYPYNARLDLTAPYGDAQSPMVVIRWKKDGEVGVAYPLEYATTKLTVPSWTE